MSDNTNTNNPEIQETVPAETTEGTNQQTSLIKRIADQHKVDAGKFWRTLKNTVFRPDRDGNEFTPEEVMLVLLIAENLKLDLLSREVYAFRGKGGTVQPIVSIDGWTKLMHRQPNYNGYEVKYSESTIELENIEKRVPEWAECTIWLKGIDHPTVERVYTEECYVPQSTVWNKYPRRMLHHRALIQAIRFSFNVSGISDVGVVDDGNVIEGDDLIQERSEAASPARRTVIKKVAFDKAALEPLALQAVQMARKMNNWDGAYRFAEQLDSAEARDFVLSRIRAAHEEDQQKALDESETI